MYQGPVIDCDVHHARATDQELLGISPRAGVNTSPTAVRPASCR